MNREALIPTDKAHWLSLRLGDLTSTDIAALFDCSPYQTRFELWHRKKNGVAVEIEENDRMKWGSRLEPAIAAGIAQDHGLTDVRPMKEYIRLPELRLGSSFDFAVGEEGGIEAKNVDALAFKEGWLVEDDQVEAPPHIELQVQHQLLVSGRSWWAIAALIGGNRGVMLHRTRDALVMDRILSEAESFWKSVDENRPPEPSLPRDADFISRLYSQSNGQTLDLSSDAKLRGLAEAYKLQSQLEKEHREAKESIKAEMLLMVRDAEKVIGDGFTISAGTVAGGRVEYDRAPYRGFRINWRKAK